MCGGSFREGAVLLPQCAANESKVSDTDESPAGTDHQQATRCSDNRPPPISPSSSSSPSPMAAIDSGRFPPRGVDLRFFLLARNSHGGISTALCAPRRLWRDGVVFMTGH